MIQFSPTYNSGNCPPLNHWDSDLKILVFEDRVNGWALNVAQELTLNDTRSGFAALSIILSYFEMIALYERGNKAPWTSRNCFYAGVESVAKHNAWPHGELQRLKSQLYTGFRCWLYHQGMVSPRVAITNEALRNNAYEFREYDLIVNPSEMVVAVQGHFAAYIERLKRSEVNAEFLAQFDRSFRGKLQYPGFHGLWQCGKAWAQRTQRLLKLFRARE